MKLKKLTYHFRLSVTEMDTFLTDFLFLFNAPVDELPDEGNDLAEICLIGKGRFLADTLADYRKGIKRPRKMFQTSTLVSLNRKRIKLLSGIIAYIRSCSNHVNPRIISAASLYLDCLKEYNRFYEGSRSAITATIRKFVYVIQHEPYTDAFAVLDLGERTEELRQVNEEYISLSDQRDIAEKTRSDAPTKVRMRCMEEYGKLVDLINLAVQNNCRYRYEEKLTELAALTAKTQELIDRRRNHALQNSISDLN